MTHILNPAAIASPSVVITMTAATPSPPPGAQGKHSSTRQSYPHPFADAPAGKAASTAVISNPRSRPKTCHTITRQGDVWILHPRLGSYSVDSGTAFRLQERLPSPGIALVQGDSRGADWCLKLRPDFDKLWGFLDFCGKVDETSHHRDRRKEIRTASHFSRLA